MYVHLVKHDGKGNSFISKEICHMHNALPVLRTEIIPGNHIWNLVILSEPNKCRYLCRSGCFKETVLKRTFQGYFNLTR